MKRKPSTDLPSLWEMPGIMGKEGSGCPIWVLDKPKRDRPVINCGQVVEMRLPMRPEEK